MNRKSLKSFFKRQTFLICSCLMIIVATSAIVSSALFTTTKSDTKEQTVESGGLNITYNQGTTISDNVYILSDDEGMKSTPYTFSVQNNENIIGSSYTIMLGRTSTTLSSSRASNLIDASYIRYSIDNGPAQTLSAQELVSSETEAGNNMYLIKTNAVRAGGTNSHSIRVWISSSAPDSQAIGKYLDLSVKVKAIVSDPRNDEGYQFVYSGSKEVYKVPYTGTYTIEAAGAQGSIGNKYGNTSSTLVGGKGAKISGTFNLNAGDILHIIVGGKAADATNATAADGVAGAGGGGSFIFKEIPTITDSRYQFTKNNINYDVLLIAAGGSGTGDLGYSTTKTLGGLDGNGVDFKSPTNFVAYSTATVNPATSTGTSSALGISQYISYDLAGGYYTKNSSTCRGAFGGGGCNDDQRGYGGGWSQTNYTTYSWSQGTNTSGVNGSQSGHGYINIKFNK